MTREVPLDRANLNPGWKFDCPKCGGCYSIGQLAGRVTTKHCCTLIERMMARIVKSESGCWLYQGAKDSWGYTHVAIHNKRIQAHRYAYEHHHGPIADGLHVLHRCDTPSCINPEHLFLGTNRDNINDCVAKARTTWGARSTKAKLTVEKVLEMRRLFKQGVSGSELARRFGVTQPTATNAVTGRSWKHL